MRRLGWRIAIAGPVCLLLFLGTLSLGCGPAGPPQLTTAEGLRHAVGPSTGARRAARRAYRGAPPVVPHEAFGSPCASCHTADGVAVVGVGFAPASPHDETAGMGAARCRQCHAFQITDELFRETSFAGTDTAPRPSSRAHPTAPPVSPHRFFLRENCLACHNGPASRLELRTTHPERARCRQCHLERNDA